MTVLGTRDSQVISNHDSSRGDGGTSTRPTVRVRGLTRSFGDRAVLDGVDLDIFRGEIVALLGASGSGKSTMLRCLAGLDADAGGEAEVPQARAVVFQENRLFPWKRVWQNIVMGHHDRDRATATNALEEVGLADKANAWPLTLSGGEAQRVSLARALVRRPHLLLLDEPFGALDALTRLHAQDLLSELCKRYNPAVLLVTHDVDEAIVLADRALVLRDGQIAVAHEISAPRPRSRTDASFIDLRRSLLADLGVVEGRGH
jgi:sulfonate transport system ATP-binding protein